MRESNSTLPRRISRRLAAVDQRLQSKVRKAIVEHFACPRRRDGRGCRACEIDRVVIALCQLGRFNDWQADKRIDLNHRREIRAIWKHIQHGQSFETTIAECRKAAAWSQRVEEAEERGSSAPIPLNAMFEAVPLNSDLKMRAAGRRGRNCLGQSQYGNLQERRDGVAEFFEIRKKDAPESEWAWLKIDRSRCVCQMLGRNNSPATLSKETLTAICQNLKVNGDQCKLFHDYGVFSLFTTGKANVEQPVFSIGHLWFWRHADEIVVFNHKTDSWSRMIRNTQNAFRFAWRAPFECEFNGRVFNVLCDAFEEIRQFALRAEGESTSDVDS